MWVSSDYALAVSVVGDEDTQGPSLSQPVSTLLGPQVTMVGLSLIRPLCMNTRKPASKIEDKQRETTQNLALVSFLCGGVVVFALLAEDNK